MLSYSDALALRCCHWPECKGGGTSSSPLPQPTLGQSLHESAWVVHPTAKGRMAQEVWRLLFGVIEKRWEVRFGIQEMKKLRTELHALVSQSHVELPEYLPVLGYGLVAEVPPRDHASPASAVVEGPSSHLAALLSKVLLAFTIHFERESEVSLAMSANVIRLIGEKGVRIRDLPRLAGVSKEAIKVSLGFLEKRGYLTLEADPTSARSKVVRLTAKGREAREAYLYRLKMIEEKWQGRFGKANINNLRNSLERLMMKTETEDPLLFQGLNPHPDGWRASVPKPESLPHHPMVLHRGGYPDGS